MKKNEIMPFAATWMDLEMIILSEISQTEKDKYLGNLKKKYYRASLVAQWLGICLPMQGTQVRALVWEDPTCRGAAGPVSHNY